MPTIDDRTANLNLPKPHADNALSDDVVRLRDALDGLDSAVADRLQSASVSAFAMSLLDDVSSGAARSTLGLGSVENKTSATIRSEITAGDIATSLTFAPENAALKGVANGYAGLDSGGKVPAAHLPAYVDDVIEVASAVSLPGTGSAGIIYVTLDNNKSLRWGGSGYVEISASPGSTDVVAEGSVNLYFTYQRVRDAVIAGLSTATNAVITAADSVLTALGKLQAQVNAKQATLVSTENIKSINATSLLGAGNISIDGLPSQTGKAGRVLGTNGAAASWGNALGVCTYDNRATLRAMTPDPLASYVVDGLGLFIWIAGSSDLDDDETIFATASGAWAMVAADPEYANLVAMQAADELNDRLMFGSFSMTATSIAGVNSAAFTASVMGAAPGDSVIVTPGNGFGTSSNDKGRLSCSGYVSAAGTVTVTVRNASASTANLTASTWSVLVIKQ